jgi:hypothetical protein
MEPFYDIGRIDDLSDLFGIFEEGRELFPIDPPGLC